ncbi:MAG: outer membrane protein assembly factor BamD [Bacteroidota bacterium]
MFKKLKLFIYLGVFALITVSCSEYEKVLKSNDTNAKLKMANELFEEGKYSKANKLFEQVLPSYRGMPQAERITFMMAESYYEMGDYLLAAYFYERFVKSYPESSKVEEAAYKQAYCYYLDSPRYTLDQENTNKAISEMQKFINRYSDSEKEKEANEIIRELRIKLEKKDFGVAQQYMKLEEYQAADIAYGNFISDFPDSDLREDAFYYKFESLYMYAKNSFYTKQQERYTSAKTAFLVFEKRYPESEKMKKAKKYYAEVLEALENAS